MEPAKRSPLLDQVIAEWRGLTRGEFAFLALLAIALVALAIVGARGPETAIPAALAFGLLGGAAIAVIRRRKERRERGG